MLFAGGNIFRAAGLEALPALKERSATHVNENITN